MSIVHISWRRIAGDLANALESSQKTISEISSESGVNYYAVRRMKSGGALIRSSRNARRLCTYFGVNANSERSTDLDTIVSQVSETWDGSGPHAQLLVELIRSTRNFAVRRVAPNVAIGRSRRKTEKARR